MSAKQTVAPLIPCLQYRDAKTMIDWLCRAFDFQQKMVVEGENGAIDHAQLTFGSGMLMISSARDEGFGQFTTQPDQAGGETQSSYIVVADTDAHYQRAKEAGADMVIDIRDEPYGGRGYSCKDPEGHLWSFGSYDPWED